MAMAMANSKEDFHGNENNNELPEPKEAQVPPENYPVAIKAPSDSDTSILMVVPQMVPNGLEPLTGIESVLIQHQQSTGTPDNSRSLKAMLGLNTSNRYHLLNNFGTEMYFAGKIATVCGGFTMNVYDTIGRKAMVMTHKCNARLACCGVENWGHNITVRSGITGDRYGSIVQRYSYFTPYFAVLDREGKEKMVIKGPCCSNSICGDKSPSESYFRVYMLSSPVAEKMRVVGSTAKDELNGHIFIGGITKQVYAQGVYSKRGMFQVHFSPQLEPQLKALLVGAGFSIGFSYFEKRCGVSICTGLLVFLLICLYVIFFLVILSVRVSFKNCHTHS